MAANEYLSVRVEADSCPAVITLAGELDAYTCPKLEEAVMSLFAAGYVAQSDVTVDMAQVSFMDSSGLNRLAQLNREANIRLREPSERVLSFLYMSGVAADFIIGDETA